ncbi:MAG: sigma-70 family RNA polymerase sigma factor [Paludisphaera borealis]|uniref:sigma-70 family RNA polymerase sigma factor n=1 Tax=Paludisphaera borealis TaxID=1387353 RepID=UPI0028520388|nr:sigma-70 family RNA polymerase sigma factor [Paludisphaera borealis]MDR3621901.1 sigma-70 family RNA polymerase sigma factor [Paludisphaera borealis]
MTRIHQDVRLVEQMETLFHAGSLGGLSDGALLDRFQARHVAGAEAAFAELVKRHGPMVFGACRRILTDPHLAEDALQATFLVLARRAGSVRNRETLGGWLHRVACRIAWRSRKRADRRRAKEEPMVEEIAAKAVDRAEDSELRSILDQEIDRLRDVQRLPVVLCCLQGLSHEEASQRLCWPLGTVKSRLARGREKLQSRLIRRGVAPALAATVLTGGMQATEAAAISSALVKSTAALAWKASFAGAGASAAVATLVGEELGSVLTIKLKIGAAVVTTGLAVAAVGFFGPSSSGQKPRGEDSPKPAAIENEARKPDPPPIVTKLSASGRVVDAAGKPIAGARVYLREWTTNRMRRMAVVERGSLNLMRGDTIDCLLANRTTDADGRFEFKDVPAPGIPRVLFTGETEYPCDVVALASGRGLAWIPLKPHHLTAPITLTLGEEGVIRGKLVEPGGNPVAGAKILISFLGKLDQPEVGELKLDTEDRMDLRWSGFLGVKTGADGRFIVRGLPLDMAVTLIVTEPRHERLMVNAATEPPPSQSKAQQKPSRDAGKPTDPGLLRGDFSLTTRVADHVLNGRVVFEADGKPAPNAQLSYVMKSATSVSEAAKLDADGRFRIEGLVPGTCVLRARDPNSDTAPGGGEVSIPEIPKETEHTLVLPRGLIVRGRVVDGATGRGVGNVALRYTSELRPRPESLSSFDSHTDADGSYRMVVPAGRGVVEVVTVPNDFDKPARRYIGEPPGASYSEEVEGQAGQAVELLDIPLRRPGGFSIRVVGQDGHPVFNAEVSILDELPWPKAAKGRTDPDGRYRVNQVRSDQSATIDVLVPDRAEGGTAAIPRTDGTAKKAGEVEVRLSPLGSLVGRVVDDEGAPLPGAVLTLYRNVRYTEQSDRSFGKPVAIDGKAANDGSYSFKGLIPGGSYNVRVEADGHATATGLDVKIKPGQEVDVGVFRLPITDQELTGVIVDPRGKPLADVSISLQHDGREQALYGPQGAVWFQNTDASGRFHLKGLPRGAKRLMAYRNEGTERNIRNLKYADVPAGQKEVRIELPDVNERLRGIE